MSRRHRIAIRQFVSERTPRPLMAPLLTFDLSKEAADLKTETAWTDHGHNARTLLKHSEMRLVLIVLDTWAHLHEQTADERLCLHVLQGVLRVQMPTETVTLARGQLLALDRKVPFSIEAVEPSELLLWLGWSQADDDTR